jgi:hypothetical protein
METTNDTTTDWGTASPSKLPTPNRPFDRMTDSGQANAREVPERYRHINGWGADLDIKNRPAYPKERTPPRLDPVPTPGGERQRETVEVLHSNERPSITPVFGTSAPPSGLSGVIRRHAFKRSENDIRHWLWLLFADRVDMVEGVVSDLARGHVPNVYKEMGGPAAMRFNRMQTMRHIAVKSAIAGALIGGAVYLAKRKRR